MLSSALQRPHADNKARETKVETSVAMQQEVKITHNTYRQSCARLPTKTNLTNLTKQTPSQMDFLLN